MAFEITEVSETSHTVRVDEKLWLTADRDRLVADGDPEAAHLFAAAGDEITRDEAEQFGLVKAKAAPADKQRAKAEDKAKPKPRSKSKPRASRPRSRTPRSKRQAG